MIFDRLAAPNRRHTKTDTAGKNGFQRAGFNFDAIGGSLHLWIPLLSQNRELLVTHSVVRCLNE